MRGQRRLHVRIGIGLLAVAATCVAILRLWDDPTASDAQGSTPNVERPNLGADSPRNASPSSADEGATREEISAPVPRGADVSAPHRSLHVTSSADFSFDQVFVLDAADRVETVLPIGDEALVDLMWPTGVATQRVAAPGHCPVDVDPSMTDVVLAPHTWITLNDPPQGAELFATTVDGVTRVPYASTESHPLRTGLPAVSGSPHACVRRSPGRIDVATSPYCAAYDHSSFDIDLNDGWRASVRTQWEAGTRAEFSLRHPDVNARVPLEIEVVDANGPVHDANLTLSIEDKAFAGAHQIAKGNTRFVLSPAAGPSRVATSDASGIGRFESVPLGLTVRAGAKTSDGRFGLTPWFAHDGSRKSMQLVPMPHVTGRISASSGSFDGQRATLFVVWPEEPDSDVGSLVLDVVLAPDAQGAFDAALQPPFPWVLTKRTFQVHRIEVAGFEPVVMQRAFSAEGGSLGDIVLTGREPFVVVEGVDFASAGVSMTGTQQKGELVYGDTLSKRGMVVELAPMESGGIGVFASGKDMKPSDTPYRADAAVLVLFGDSSTYHALRRTERGTYATVPTRRVTLNIGVAHEPASTDELWIRVCWPRPNVTARVVDILECNAVPKTTTWTLDVPRDASIAVDRVPRGIQHLESTPPLASWSTPIDADTIELPRPRGT